MKNSYYKNWLELKTSEEIDDEKVRVNIETIAYYRRNLTVGEPYYTDVTLINSDVVGVYDEVEEIDMMLGKPRDFSAVCSHCPECGEIGTPVIESDD